MITFNTKQDYAVYCQQLKQAKPHIKIGFVPTMGALHDGHISLITAAKKQCDWVICSIFVNPTQFNDKKDFEKYPITIDSDVAKLKEAKCDALFLPSVNEIYSANYTTKHYDLGFLENTLEGSFRPGHFQGVCQVVDILLQAIQPTVLFLGQKDYQQCMVISKLIQLTKLSIELCIVPTQREPSGLAMSSRNMRLSNEAKKNATAIYQAMQLIKQHIFTTSIEDLTQQAKQILLNNGFNVIDYVSIVNATTLQPITTANSNTKMVVLVAAFIEEVRLIDNLAIN